MRCNDFLTFQSGTLALLFVLGSLFCVEAAAQEVRIHAETDGTTVGSGETVSYTVTVEAPSLDGLETPRPPSTAGLVVDGSTPSTSRGARREGDDFYEQARFTWQFTPLGVGQARIEAAEVSLGGRTYRTEPIEIEVVPQTERTLRDDSDREREARDEDDRLVQEGDVQIEVEASRQNVIRNEPILLTYRLYFRDGVILHQSRMAGGWDTPGFWREDLNVPSRPEAETIVRNGESFHAFLLKQTVVFPSQSGTLEIAPFEIESTARPHYRTGHPLDRYRPSSREQRIEVASESKVIEVSEPPSGAPSTFTGSVGQFTMRDSVNRESISVGESVDYTVEIEGTGNLALLELPELDFPDGFEVFRPDENVTFNRDGGELTGRKSFTFSLVGQETGTFTLPSVEFSYFDDAMRRYQTVRSGGMEIEVTEAPTPALTSAAEEAASRFAPSDESGRVISPWAAAAATGLLALLGLLAYRLRQDEEDADLKAAGGGSASPDERGGIQQKPAVSVDTALAAAYRSARRGDAVDCCDAVERALRGALTERFNRPAQGLTRGEISEMLRQSGTSRAEREKLRSVLDACDRIRYAPRQHDENLKSLVDEAKGLCEALRGEKS